jgi:hypothetical protein
MFKRFVVPMLFVLTLSACGMTEATPASELEEIVLPSGVGAQLDARIQESTRQNLSNGRDGYFLLQFSAPLDQDTRATLEAAGVVFYDYVPNYAYYVYLPSDSLAVLGQLVEAETIRHVGPIPIEAKVEAGLREKMRADADRRFDVIVQFFEEPSPAEREKLEALIEGGEYSFGPVNLVEGTVAATDAETILSLPFVKWMEEQVPIELGD